MPAGFLVRKTPINVFVTVISRKYVLLASYSDHTDIFIKQRIECCFSNTTHLRPHNSTHCAMLYPQNGDRIVAIDSVTSLHPMCWLAEI